MWRDSAAENGLLAPSPSSATWPGAVANAISVPAPSVEPAPSEAGAARPDPASMPRLATGGRHLRRHRIVAAGVEDENVGAELVVEAGHDGIHVHHRIRHAPAGLKCEIDRHQIVAAVDLHAMAGVVDHRHLAARGLAQEIADRLLHRRAVEIDAFGDGKADVAQAFCNGMRVIGRIGQRLDMGIGAVADHERDAPAGRHASAPPLAMLRAAALAGGAASAGFRGEGIAGSDSNESRTFAIA